MCRLPVAHELAHDSSDCWGMCCSLSSIYINIEQDSGSCDSLAKGLWSESLLLKGRLSEAIETLQNRWHHKAYWDLVDLGTDYDNAYKHCLLRKGPYFHMQKGPCSFRGISKQWMDEPWSEETCLDSLKLNRLMEFNVKQPPLPVLRKTWRSQNAKVVKLSLHYPKKANCNNKPRFVFCP